VTGIFGERHQTAFTGVLHGRNCIQSMPPAQSRISRCATVQRCLPDVPVRWRSSSASSCLLFP
jgi:hypothetical protein